MNQLEEFTKQLLIYCRTEQYKGWDPYDGLNSRVFNFLLFNKIPLFRLAFIQFFKKSPLNLRKLFLIKKDYNPKGIALILNACCNLYHSKSYSTTDKDVLYLEIEKLTDLLISLKTKEEEYSCWGYNFPWQARLLFLFPSYTPTVVATSFAVEALSNAFSITGNRQILEEINSAGEFVKKRLNRSTYKGKGIVISYSPLSGNNQVWNASLLGAKILSYAYKYDPKNEESKNLAYQVVETACRAQKDDGSWVYGQLNVQSWIDSFHTGYNLDAIATFQKNCKTQDFTSQLDLGFNYYINNFFLDNGTPKYYHDKIYPIDIHCPGQLFVTANKLEKNTLNIENKVLKWTFENMRSPSLGYFYFQKYKYYTIKIPYMRWSNAFFLNALSYSILNHERNTH